MTARLRKAGARLQRARAGLKDATAAARSAAIEAAAGGMPETEIAKTLGVDRAKTLRRWLGKG